MVSKHQLQTYLKIREISGLSKNWIRDMKRCITRYLDYLKWNITLDKSLEYFNIIKDEYSHTNYRRNLYQIRKFLYYLEIDWAKNIHPPADLEYIPKRIIFQDIQNTLLSFKGDNIYPKLKALIYLGVTSGLRSKELYQLRLEDIDIENRIIYVNHNPKNGQTTKNKKSRISFINEEAKNELLRYIKSVVNKNNSYIFNQRQIQNRFQNNPLKVKHLRKFFSQEWDRRGGPTSIKKILMGHSLKGDIDMMHYNCQSEEDLKRIYDKVMFGD